MIKYIFCTALALLFINNCQASTTTTTTTKNADGSTTTVEETTTSESSSTPNLIGPKGATGVIRRSDRRQERRLEEDLDNLDDAIDRRPGIERRR